MSKSKISYVFVVLALMALGGCVSQQKTQPVESICQQNTSPGQAMKIAENVLTRMHFTIEKADSEQGLIRTAPLPAAHLLEFWRKDNIGAFNTAEANLHSLRRTAELTIKPQNSDTCIDCSVSIQRLSLSNISDYEASGEYALFPGYSRSRRKLKLKAMQQSWIDLGQDDALATEILKQIENRLKVNQL